LSEETKRLFRNAHIGVAIGCTLAVVGAILFHGNEGMQELMALVTFAVAMGVYLTLNARDDRARAHEPDNQV
jgi:undecaprenyl pyrophosphate phosphatase UppP